jgi:NACalpha-BTF3-like transcription factor
VAAGRELAAARGDLSAHRLRVAAECGLRYRFKYVDKLPELPESDGTGAMADGKELHTAIELALRPFEEKPGPHEVPVSSIADQLTEASELHGMIARWGTIHLGDVVAIERGGTTKITAGPTLGWIVDMAHVIHPPGRWRNVLEVVDWKTGFMTLDDDELADDWQANVYALATQTIMRKLPPAVRAECEAQVTFRYLSTGEKATLHVTDEVLAKAKARMIGAWRKVTLNKLPATVGAHCDRCPFRDRCKPAAKRLADMHEAAKVELAPSVLTLSDVALVQKRQAAREAAKALEEHQGDLSAELGRRIAQQGTIEAPHPEGGVWRAAQRERRSSDFDPAVIPDVAKRLQLSQAAVWQAVGTVSSTALQGLVADTPTAEVIDSYRGPPVRYVEVRRGK